MNYFRGMVNTTHNGLIAQMSAYTNQMVESQVSTRARFANGSEPISSWVLKIIMCKAVVAFGEEPQQHFSTVISK